MTLISILYLRRELTRVVGRVAKGESFTVTYRGKPIFTIAPIEK